MKYALILLSLLLIGCGDYTRADFKRHHPWSMEGLVDVPTADNGHVATYVYPDALPSIHPVTGHYAREHGVHILKVRAADDMVIERRWERHHGSGW